MIQLMAGPFGPLAIFLLRIGDVSLSTVRTILIFRGHRLAVPLLGFVESLVWVLAVSAAIRNLNSPLHVLGYASGFAVGNAVGLWIEQRLALGLAAVRVIPSHAEVHVADAMRASGHGATEFAGQGLDGPVSLIYSIVRRRELAPLLRLVERTDPEAFIAVDDARALHRGWMTGTRRE